MIGVAVPFCSPWTRQKCKWKSRKIERKRGKPEIGNACVTGWAQQSFHESSEGKTYILLSIKNILCHILFLLLWSIHNFSCVGEGTQMSFKHKHGFWKNGYEKHIFLERFSGDQTQNFWTLENGTHYGTEISNTASHCWSLNLGLCCGTFVVSQYGYLLIHVCVLLKTVGGTRKWSGDHHASPPGRELLAILCCGLWLLKWVVKIPISITKSNV